MYISTINFMEDYKESTTLLDITPGLLIKVKQFKLAKDIRTSSISAYFRHLRAVINYYMYELKTTPPSYKYPFGKGGYTIKRYQNHRDVKIIGSIETENRKGFLRENPQTKIYPHFHYW